MCKKIHLKTENLAESFPEKVEELSEAYQQTVNSDQ